MLSGAHLEVDGPQDLMATHSNGSTFEANDRFRGHRTATP